MMNLQFRVLLITIGILLILSWRLRVNHLKAQEDKNTIAFLEDRTKHVEKQWRGKDSLWRNKTESLEISNKSLLKLAKDKDEFATKLLKEHTQIKKNFKNLLSYNDNVAINKSHVDGILHDTIVIQKNDTIKERFTTITTQWDDYSVAIKGDSIGITREGREEFDQIVFWERNKIIGLRIGRKKWFSEIKSLNPNTKIISQHSFLITKNKKKIFQ
jgi:hypothetical protein